MGAIDNIIYGRDVVCLRYAVLKSVTPCDFSAAQTCMITRLVTFSSSGHVRGCWPTIYTHACMYRTHHNNIPAATFSSALHVAISSWYIYCSVDNVFFTVSTHSGTDTRGASLSEPNHYIYSTRVRDYLTIRRLKIFKARIIGVLLHAFIPLHTFIAKPCDCSKNAPTRN